MRSRWLNALLALVAGGVLLWTWPWVRPAFAGGAAAAAELLGRVGPFGPLVVVGLQALQAVISPLPSWPITIAAGALYGPALGTAYSLVGGTVGAVFNFLLARRYGQPLVRRLFGERWVERAGKLGAVHFFALSLLGRLIPIASFDAVAYVAGISQIGLGTFIGVAALGQAPALYAYAAFGSDLATAEKTGLWGSSLLLLMVALLVWGPKLWKRISS